MGGKYKSERENIVTTKNLYSEVQVSKNSKGTKKVCQYLTYLYSFKL